MTLGGFEDVLVTHSSLGVGAFRAAMGGAIDSAINPRLAARSPLTAPIPLLTARFRRLQTRFNSLIAMKKKPLWIAMNMAYYIAAQHTSNSRFLFSKEHNLQIHPRIDMNSGEKRFFTNPLLSNSSLPPLLPPSLEL